jgi:hypothetical protein
LTGVVMRPRKSREIPRRGESFPGRGRDS